MGRGGSFSEKKMKRKIQVDLSFFSEKNIKDRFNAIVRFVLSLGNMSKVLRYIEIKIQDCVVKKYPGPKTSSCPA